MTEKFDSPFHKKYVGGVGVVEEKPVTVKPQWEYRGDTYEDVLAAYRKYVGDPNATLPDAIIEELERLGKI